MAETYEKIYGYEPSLPLALVAALLFGVITFLQTYQLIRSKTWFMIAFVLGGYCKAFTQARAISTVRYLHNDSRSPWLPRTSLLDPATSQLHLDPVRSSPRAHPRRALTLRRQHIYVSRPHYPPAARRASLHRTHRLADQDLHPGRRRILRDPSDRCGSPVAADGRLIIQGQ